MTIDRTYVLENKDSANPVGHKALSFLCFLHLFLNPILSAVLYDLCIYRASFYFRPLNTLTHCMAALLGIVNGVQRKELGRQTGKRIRPRYQVRVVKKS